MTRRRGAIVLAPFALVCVLAACGRTGGDEDGKDRPASVDAPLGLDQAGLALQQTRVEELVKGCMKQAGFDYVPIDPTATRAAIIGTSGLSDSEYRRQFGYGISTVFEKVIEVAQSPDSVDPNIAYRNHLDPAGQAAFDKALTGGSNEVSVSGALDAAKTGDLTGLSGCVKQGVDAVFGNADVTTALAKIDELDKRAEADPRLVAAKQKWSECMKQAGFSYSVPDAVDGAMQDKLAVLVGVDAARSINGEGGSFNTAAFRSSALPTYDKDALAKLQAEEIATARADLACEEKHVAAIEANVKAEYEKRFAEENAVLLTNAQARLRSKP